MILAVAMLTALVAFFVWVEGFCTTNTIDINVSCNFRNTIDVCML